MNKRAMNKRAINFSLSIFCIFFVTACSEDQPTMACLPESEAGQTVNISGGEFTFGDNRYYPCLLYTSPSPRDRQKSRMPSSA